MCWNLINLSFSHHSLIPDYTTANDPSISPPLSDDDKANLYAELASGAETGWDYTIRWFSAANASEGLRSLNVRNTIGVDLNSILCTFNKICLPGFWNLSNVFFKKTKTTF